jgi:hypothetical protein
LPPTWQPICLQKIGQVSKNCKNCGFFFEKTEKFQLIAFFSMADQLDIKEMGQILLLF